MGGAITSIILRSIIADFGRLKSRLPLHESRSEENAYLTKKMVSF